MGKVKLGEMLINLALWTCIGLIIVGFVTCVAGCSIPEWKDIGTDVGTKAVEILPKVAVNPTPSTFIFEIVAGIGAIIAGWYGRKYAQKLYEKKKKSPDAGPAT